MGLAHVRRAACPVKTPESAEWSRAGGGYAISLVVLAATKPRYVCFVLAVFACCVVAWTGFRAAAGANRLWEAGGVVVGVRLG